MNIKNHNIFFTLIAALILIGLPSCQKSEVNSLQDAQLCLNTATQDTARACVSGIASDKTAFADSLRCSAIFISEGFGSPAQLYEALSGITSGSATCGGSGNCSPTAAALVNFSFKSAGTATPDQRAINTATSNEAFAVCSQSNVKFYAQVSSLFNIGTLATGYLGVVTDSNNIEAAITSIPAATLGEIVITTYASVCETDDASTELPDSTKQYCSELSVALSTTNATPESIGTCLKARLNDPTATCL